MTDYANGEAPESALVAVDGVHMVPAIAPRVEAFFAEAAREGHELHIAKPYGGYRTLHEQQIIYAQGATGGSTVRPAKPGSSTHGIYATGRVDIVGANGSTYTKAELAWVVANAGRFGLTREFGAADPNHFEQSGTFAGDGSTPLDNTTTTTKDPKMTAVTFLKQSTLDSAGSRVKGHTVFAIADLALRDPSNWQEGICAYTDGGPGDVLAQFAKGLGGSPSVVLSDPDWDRWKTVLNTTSHVDVTP